MNPMEGNPFCLRQKKKTYYLSELQIKQMVTGDNKNSIDPYRMFNLSKNYTLEELRKQYKRLAIQVHPDKTGGSDYLFQQCYAAYKFLVKEFEKRKVDRPFNELRSESKSYIDTQQQQRTREGGGSKPKFNIASFNRIFEDNRMEDVNQSHGYGRWMATSSQEREDFQQKNTVGKYTHEGFNRAFDSQVPLSKSQTSLIRRAADPVAAASTSEKTDCEELGLTRITDFGDRLTNRGISYADYKRAHSTHRLVDPHMLEAVTERSHSVSVDNAMRRMEAERERVAYVMNDRDRRKYEKQKIAMERKEQGRLHEIKRRDELIEQNFNRMQRLLLGGR